MSFVFPNALAATTANLALSRGAYWFGMVFLAAVFAVLAAIQLDRGTLAAWPALVALLAIAAAGTALARPAGDRPVVVAAAALAALAAWTLLVVVLVPLLAVNNAPNAASDAILLSMPKIALISFGAVVARRRSGVVGVVVASVVAECPVLLVSLAQGRPISFDVPAAAILVALLAVMLLLSVSRRRSRASEPLLSRAGWEDLTAAASARAEHSSSAMVHDTILNELAVVGLVAPGELSPAAREQIMRSLDRVASADREVVTPTTTGVLDGEIAAAVAWARAQGLEVVVDGDTGAVDGLPAETAAALGRAVLQCLGNVVSHAGVASAELTVIATERDVCVMVIDSGVGFTESETSPDRLGIKRSVRGRIVDIGGSVQIWSAPGAGTAVSMLVPR